MPASDQDRIGQMTRAGVAAAIVVARDQGLPADDPRLLSSRGNVLVHLAPAPVVARVATLTAWTRAEPLRWLEREVAVAGYLSANGAPVVPPTPLAEPGPHLRDGLAVSLWTLIAPSGGLPEPAETGRALAGLHAAGSGFPAELPLLAPLTDLITDGLAALERDQVLPAQALGTLRDRHAEILSAIGLTSPASSVLPVLHGDAHAGNMLRYQDTWTWVDLEETCRGPRAFDLAVLASTSDDGSAALAAYCAELGMPLPEPGQLAPFVRARELEAAVWLAGMAHQYPQRYAGQARDRLAGLLRS